MCRANAQYVAAVKALDTEALVFSDFPEIISILIFQRNKISFNTCLVFQYLG